MFIKRGLVISKYHVNTVDFFADSRYKGFTETILVYSFSVLHIPELNVNISVVNCLKWFIYLFVKMDENSTNISTYISHIFTFYFAHILYSTRELHTSICHWRNVHIFWDMNVSIQTVILFYRTIQTITQSIPNRHFTLKYDTPSGRESERSIEALMLESSRKLTLL